MENKKAIEPKRKVRFDIKIYRRTVYSLISEVGTGFPAPDKGERGFCARNGVLVEYPSLRHHPLFQAGCF